MTNGFYNTDGLSEDKVKSFMEDAIQASYHVMCQTIVGTQRQVTRNLFIKQFIIDALNSDFMLYVVDRFTHGQGVFTKEYSEYEICLTYDSNFLYVFVNEENFNKLVDKYELKLREWK
jgi:hypothetical protein